jgi:hypothetical protein
MADLGDSAAGMYEDMAFLGHQLRDLAAHVERLEAQINEHQSELTGLRRELETLRTAPPAAPPAAAAAPEAAAQRPRVPITPAMANVLKLVHAGQAEEAKRALAAIPAEERNANPAVLAIAAAALCIARDDFTNALTALNKARQLTDDPRLLRIVELTASQVPQV